MCMAIFWDRYRYDIHEPEKDILIKFLYFSEREQKWQVSNSTLIWVWIKYLSYLDFTFVIIIKKTGKEQPMFSSKHAKQVLQKSMYKF